MSKPVNDLVPVHFRIPSRLNLLIARGRRAPALKLIEKMLAAKKDWAAAEDDYEKRCLDREIDRLVYKLYELTEEEIAVVEGR